MFSLNKILNDIYQVTPLDLEPRKLVGEHCQTTRMVLQQVANLVGHSHPEFAGDLHVVQDG